jgi:hypothetical protein
VGHVKDLVFSPRTERSLCFMLYGSILCYCKSWVACQLRWVRTPVRKLLPQFWCKMKVASMGSGGGNGEKW